MESSSSHVILVDEVVNLLTRYLVNNLPCLTRFSLVCKANIILYWAIELIVSTEPKFCPKKFFDKFCANHPQHHKLYA